MDALTGLKICREQLGLVGATIEVLQQGRGGLVGLVNAGDQKYVLKVGIGIPRDEVGIRHLENNNIPLPELIAKGQSKDIGWVLLTYIEGESLFSAQSSKVAQVDVGRILRRVHDVSPNGFDEPYAWRGVIQSWLERDLSWWVKNKYGTTQEANLVRDQLSSLWEDLKQRSPAATILKDGRPEHFIIKGDQLVGIIDLGEVWVGDQLMDLGVLFANDAQLAPGVLKGYAPTYNEYEKFLEYIPLYTFLRRTSQAMWLEENNGSVFRKHTLLDAIRTDPLPGVDIPAWFPSYPSLQET